jgi:hypothetical protein
LAAAALAVLTGLLAGLMETILYLVLLQQPLEAAVQAGVILVPLCEQGKTVVVAVVVLIRLLRQTQLAGLVDRAIRLVHLQVRVITVVTVMEHCLAHWVAVVVVVHQRLEMLALQLSEVMAAMAQHRVLVAHQ